MTPPRGRPALRLPLDPLPLPPLPERPLVTFVVTGACQDPALQETLASVANQTYQDIEVVLVDASGQATAQQVARAFPPTTYVPHAVLRPPKDLGKARNRQLGFECTRGDLVVFLDCGDLAFPDRVERQVRQIQEHGLDAAYGHFVRVQEDVGRVIAGPPPVQRPESWDPGRFVENLVYHRGPMVQGGLFKTSLLRAIGGIDQGFPKSDWPFMVEAARRGGRMLVSAEPVWCSRDPGPSHPVADPAETLQWQLAVARHYCSPAVRRTSAARSYRIAAEQSVRAGRVGRGVAWFARANLQRLQKRKVRFLRAAARAALRGGRAKKTGGAHDGDA